MSGPSDGERLSATQRLGVMKPWHGVAAVMTSYAPSGSGFVVVPITVADSRIVKL